MTDVPKPATPADRQVERLENLKRLKDDLARKPDPSLPKAPQPRTAAERTLERLEAMRQRLSLPLSAPPPAAPAPPEDVPAAEAAPAVEKAPEAVPLSAGAPPPPAEPALPGTMESQLTGADFEADDPPTADPSTTMVPLGHHAFPRFEGKYKSVKLTVAQMRVLEQLYAADHRLYPGRILRIALNLWMGIPNQIPEDRELEPLARTLVKHMGRPPGGGPA